MWLIARTCKEKVPIQPLALLWHTAHSTHKSPERPIAMTISSKIPILPVKTQQYYSIRHTQDNHSRACGRPYRAMSFG